MNMVTPNPEKHASLPIEGMTCAACSTRLEKVLGKLDGVSDASVNLAMEQADVTYDAAKLSVTDLTQAVAKAGFSVPEESREYAISGMTCAACSTRLEKVLNKLEGVEKATVNLTTERASISSLGGLSAAAVIAAVKKAGFEASPVMEEEAGEEEAAFARQSRKDQITFIVSALLTLPFMYQMAYQVLVYEHWMIDYTTQLILATPVQFWAGWRFYKSAWGALKGLSGNMDLLVVMGTLSAFGLSVFLMLTVDPNYGHEHLYFEASTAVITLVLLGKWMESRAKRSTTQAIRALMKLRPQNARVIKDGQEITVPAEAVASGDIVIVKPGEKIPVDGEIVEGATQVDESLITGESLPVSKGNGDMVTGGAINGEGMVRLRATTVGKESMLSKIIALVQGAQATKPPVQKLVDRIAAIFVPVVLVIALITFVGWQIAGWWYIEAIYTAVTVLVIACPCALGLATPTAVMVGTGVAASNGILIKEAESLERSKAIDTVVFDKTGTLTEGRPVIQEIVPLIGDEDSLLKLAASAQQGSEHPLARAVLDRAEGDLFEVSDFQSQTGRGLTAKVDGRHVAIGNRRLMKEHGIETSDLEEKAVTCEEQGQTVMWIGCDERLLGIIAVGDAIKQNAKEAVAGLVAMGIRPVMLTGDNRRSAQAVAESVGIKDVIAEVLPENKAQEIEKLIKAGRVTAMVGDGINDAPALAVADVGMAMGTGTDVAMHTAGITLMRGDPALVADAIDVSRATYGKIRQNLFWAFFYNVIALPLAAFGFLSPVIAGAAMAMSSVSVVTNSLVLKRWKPKRRA